MNNLISKTQPDIVCFQEDDFNGRFMPEGYTCGNYTIESEPSLKRRY